MDFKKVKRYGVLGILFFLPVIFLLFLYPATHHYTPLDIVKESVSDLETFTSNTNEKVLLKDHITVLGFFGENPMENVIAASNLKELVYDKFKGFKKFQVVIVVPDGTQMAIEQLKNEINPYEDIRFWHFMYGHQEDIHNLFNSLSSKLPLNTNFSTNLVYIIDKDLNQRGRIDDRTDNEVVKKQAKYGLSGYDCIEVAEIKNKMSEDMRILFTEYRQKRKGDFDSTTRRANDLKEQNEKK
ncbi:MAG: hypothetical protein GW839_10420 [Flavobacteriales bacterium]|nr:hypothetical protein [Flavobacteriia bacterium]NCP06565.1 hypothetical protein [Flavobacteriales bacterium]PIV94341.1 MAG: hypothetical protein COW44_04690 [Flavobacteriaceae bacterium CG17_big_fil_post_rev_8_21_14_2_50_33_15]PIY10403.1 MAG: hypothetical protein COZ17_10040 [Flavobacteriaceae bacterium CG_4_10_14_3_um_filter_33_47]PJB20440.1 MAG: hypothetical protein CO117_00900 [Flavobacteriaceae bacterium CG_4_9_14_3_um_filter_33_16]